MDYLFKWNQVVADFRLGIIYSLPFQKLELHGILIIILVGKFCEKFLQSIIYELGLIIVKKNDSFIEVIKDLLIDFFKLIFFNDFCHYQLLFMIDILQCRHDVCVEKRCHYWHCHYDWYMDGMFVNIS